MSDGVTGSGAASGEDAVNSPLTQRLWLPKTLAQNPQMKAKPVMTNKLGRSYTEMEPADVFAVRFQTSRLNFISHLHGSARAPFSLGQARTVGQKIHFMSSARYTESRC